MLMYISLVEILSKENDRELFNLFLFVYFKVKELIKTHLYVLKS